MIALTVNGTPRKLDVAPDMPLLWAIRESLGLTGTKYGCGMALCGACTVHVDGAPTRACVTPVSAVAGKRVTTIEGLSEKTDHPVQRAVLADFEDMCGTGNLGYGIDGCSAPNFAMRCTASIDRNRLHSRFSVTKLARISGTSASTTQHAAQRALKSGGGSL